MGEICAILKFETGPPSVEVLRHRLQQATGFEVQLEVVDRHTLGNGWIIQFRSPADNYHTDVEVSWCRDTANVTEGMRRVHLDAFNRCPNYSFVATVAALRDLGGKIEFGSDTPEYAKENFATWKKLNRGVIPTWWKLVLGWILAGLSFLIVGGTFAAVFLIMKCFDLLLWIAAASGRAIRIVGKFKR